MSGGSSCTISENGTILRPEASSRDTGTKNQKRGRMVRLAMPFLSAKM